MTETHSRARQQAEAAFAQAQSEFLSRETPVEEIAAAARERADKTLRLRTARLAKEREDRAKAAAPSRPARTTRT